MVAIDTHAHYVPPAYFDALGRHAASDDVFAAANAIILGVEPSSPLRTIDERIAGMDSGGIDISVLSLPPPSVFFADETFAADAASSANEELISGAGEAPDRFRVLAAVPLPHVEAALAELRRVADDPLVRGVGLVTPTTSDWTMDEPRFEPFFQEVADLGLPVVAHPSLETLPASFADFALAASFAPLVSSTVGVVRLALSGMLDRVPSLQVIVPHLGGLIPFIAQRLVDQSGTGQAEHDIMYYLRERLYFDNCSYHHPALRCTLETVGPERIMLGSDYPFRGPAGRCVEDITSAGLAPDVESQILGGTASRWFG